MEKIYIKNKQIFKSRTQMIVYIILFCLLIWAFIYLGSVDFSESVPDSERFAEEFSLVGKDNVFEYATAVDARIVASGKDGIVLFGTNNEWVDYYANIINRVAKRVGVEKIYYYDFIKNRMDNNGTYEDIVEKLGNYVTYNDLGKAEIYAPSLLVVRGGNIIYFDNATSFTQGKTSPSVYWNSFRVGEKEQELMEVFSTYLGVNRNG